ncbi:MAG TPA: METTL5 family protein [Thermoplasmata archaeon]|nr:METTL5 family protein [Thermoplasmata archaeon]
MKKKDLEIALQKLKPIGSRSPQLEQYATPAIIASDILWDAYAAGDIEGKAVADLGCGNGIFCIGAKLLGATLAYGIDVSPEAIAAARQNAAELSLEVEFETGDISNAKGSFDTVIQNPPFGAQKRHADRPFIVKSLELAPKVYSLHMADTQEFVKKLVNSLGARCEPVKRFKFEIPYAFEFHTKPKETITVVLLRFDR